MRGALAAALRLDPEDPRRATALNNVGFVLHARGELAEAAIFYRQALALRERWLGPGDPAVAQSLVNLAELQRERGRLGDALQAYRRASAIRREAMPGTAGLAAALRGLGAVQVELARTADAEASYREALALAGRLGDGHPEIRSTRRALATLLAGDGRTDEALALLRDARRDAQDEERLPVLLDEAALLLAAGRDAAAQTLMEEALVLLDRPVVLAEPLATAGRLAAIARLQRAAGLSQEAWATAGRARTLLEEDGGGQHRQVRLELLATMALWRLEDGAAVSADALLVEALALARGGAETAPLLRTRARLLRALGREEEARRIEARSAEVEAEAEAAAASVPEALLAEPGSGG